MSKMWFFNNKKTVNNFGTTAKSFNFAGRKQIR